MNAGNQLKPLSAQDHVQAIQNTENQITQIDQVIKNLQAGKAVDMNQILGLASAHPELLVFINDIDKLQQKLMTLRTSEEENLRSSFREIVMNSSAIYASGTQRQSAYDAGSRTYAEQLRYEEQYLGATASQETENLVQDLVEQLVQEVMQSLTGALSGGTNGEQSPFEAAVLLQQMREAMSEILTGTNTEDVGGSFTYLLSLFPELDAGTATVEDLQREIDNFSYSVESSLQTLGPFGELLLGTLNNAA